MKILVANLGSTSYKYTLFATAAGAGTAVDDAADGLHAVASGKFERVTDHGAVIAESLNHLIAQGHLGSLDDLDAVGFKTVMGGDVSGCRRADETVLAALDATAPLAPAHNPPYAAGIRQFAKAAPKAELVALFETAFYQWVPLAARTYALPAAWRDAGVRRYGFHGASHKYIAERSAELLGRPDVAQRVRQLYHGPLAPLSGPDLAVISCHLGGSSSVTGILNGVAIGTSMGLSPQSGLPQNNRVGDLDSAAIPFAQTTLGLSLDEVNRQLTTQSGLLGLSGVSNDLRDLQAQSAQGHAGAKLAIDVLVHETRRWASAFLFDLGRLDALVFTAGIGENNPDLRAAICAGLTDLLGLAIDPAANAACRATEAVISAPGRAKVMVIPANEELVVATETARFLRNQ